MKTLNIFVAGSKQLQQERDSIRAIFSILNNKYGEQLFIKVLTYEDFDRSFNLTGRQEDYNSFLKNDADYAIFILDSSVGGITLQEFQIAIDSFRARQTPKIFVYNKKCEENAEITMIHNIINQEKQYYVEYSNIYELKSEIEKDFVKIILDLIIAAPKERIESNVDLKSILEHFNSTHTQFTTSDKLFDYLYVETPDFKKNIAQSDFLEILFHYPVHLLETYKEDFATKCINVSNNLVIAKYLWSDKTINIFYQYAGFKYLWNHNFDRPRIKQEYYDMLKYGEAFGGWLFPRSKEFLGNYLSIDEIKSLTKDSSSAVIQAAECYLNDILNDA